VGDVGGALESEIVQIHGWGMGGGVERVVDGISCDDSEQGDADLAPVDPCCACAHKFGKFLCKQAKLDSAQKITP
jgi:hypothetical protein